MKNAVRKLVVLILLAFATNLFAHDHKKVEKKDSTNQNSQIVPAQEHHHDHAGSDEQEITAFPNYHPLVVHFPIVFLLVAALFQLLSFFIYKREFGMTTFILLTLGAISAWVSSNVFHAHTQELNSPAKEILETHEQMASLTWWFALSALLFKSLSLFYFKRSLWVELLVTVLLIVSSVTVSIAGHHGAMLVHIQGIGPKGKYLESHHHEH